MQYSENQLFYTALYWVHHLPNGQRCAESICQRYAKPYVNMVQYGRQHEVQTTDEQQADLFFDTLYQSLIRGEFIERAAKSGKFIELKCEAMDVFSPPVQNAIITAGVNLIHMSGNARSFTHDGGRFYVNGSRGVWDVRYPDQQDDGYKTVSLHWDDLENAKRGRCEYYYRIVDVQKGQKVIIKKDGFEEECTIEGNDYMIVCHKQASVSLSELTDEEILTGSDKILNSAIWDKSSLQAGGVTWTGLPISETDDPRILRALSQPLRYFDVLEKIEMLWGERYARAERGDKIVIGGDGQAPSVVTRADLVSGKTRLIPEFFVDQMPKSTPVKKPVLK